MTLAEFLAQTAPTTERLSLVHCTTAGNGFGLLANGSLTPAHCPVYDADLLYLFYGRPAYKPAAGIGPSGILDLAPICLILQPDLLDQTVRILPFDSGGFHRYAPLIGPSLTRADFELTGDPTAPLRLVKAFFETNKNYYEQAPALQEKAIPPSRQTARAIARLLWDPSLRELDDRCGTIELQFDSSLPLASSLEAIIAPATMLSDPEVEQALDKSPNAIRLPYKTYGRFEPLSFANTIYERVETFLQSKSLLT